MNLDPRATLNTEMGVLVDSVELAKQVRALFERNVAPESQLPRRARTARGPRLVRPQPRSRAATRTRAGCKHLAAPGSDTAQGRADRITTVEGRTYGEHGRLRIESAQETQLGRPAHLDRDCAVRAADALYTLFLLWWSYSEASVPASCRTSRERGWICKTYEGELAQYVVGGVAPQIWHFSVRDPGRSPTNCSRPWGIRCALHYGSTGIADLLFRRNRLFRRPIGDCRPPDPVAPVSGLTIEPAGRGPTDVSAVTSPPAVSSVDSASCGPHRSGHASTCRRGARATGRAGTPAYLEAPEDERGARAADDGLRQRANSMLICTGPIEHNAGIAAGSGQSPCQIVCVSRALEPQVVGADSARAARRRIAPWRAR